MSANVNVTNADARKRILLVAANPSISKTTGWPIVFWWAELTHPYWVFTEAGYDVEVRSPAGGALQADSYSDPEDASGYSAHDILSLGFKRSPAHAALLHNTRSIDRMSTLRVTAPCSSPADSRPCTPSAATARSSRWWLGSTKRGK